MADDFDELAGITPEPEKPAKKVKAAEPRLHDILSNEEVLEARAKARATLDKERRTAAMKDVEARETRRLRLEDGLTSGIGYLNEIVDVTIDLPPVAAFILVNGPMGHAYHHGRTYPVPRHVANSLNETMGRMWRQADQEDGKDLTQTYGRKRNTTINGRTGSTSNAPARFDA